MLGRVLYSRCLHLDQCKLHLEDGKGTNERISKSKKQIHVLMLDARQPAARTQARKLLPGFRLTECCG